MSTLYPSASYAGGTWTITPGTATRANTPAPPWYPSSDSNHWWQDEYFARFTSKYGPMIDSEKTWTSADWFALPYVDLWRALYLQLAIDKIGVSTPVTDALLASTSYPKIRMLTNPVIETAEHGWPAQFTDRWPRTMHGGLTWIQDRGSGLLISAYDIDHPQASSVNYLCIDGVNDDTKPLCDLLGAPYSSSTYAAALGSLIDSRYTAGRYTVVTTDLTMAQWPYRYLTWDPVGLYFQLLDTDTAWKGWHGADPPQWSSWP